MSRQSRIVVVLSLALLGTSLLACGQSPEPKASTSSQIPHAGTSPLATTPAFTTLSATLTTRTETSAHSGVFTCDAAGDWSLRPGEAEPTPSTGLSLVSKVYNARRHVLLETYRRPDGRLVSYVYADFWPYEDPTGMPGSSGLLDWGEAWIVRAAARDGDPALSVQETVVDGRPAWRATLPRFRGVEDTAVTVDRQTGLPLEVSVPEQQDPSAGGGYTVTLTDLHLEAPLPADAFSVAPPQGARVRHQLRADYYCGLHDVAARVGFQPFVPASAALPAGYRLTDVATDERAATEFSGWSEPDPRDPHSAEFLRYRGPGLDGFTIQIAAVSRRGRREALAALKPSGLAPASRVLSRGAFAGRKARTWFDNFGATLVVAGEQHVAYITGTLSREELYSVAEGLRQR